MASKGGLSTQQVRILQLALARHKDRSGSLFDYFVAVRASTRPTELQTKQVADLSQDCLRQTFEVAMSNAGGKMGSVVGGMDVYDDAIALRGVLPADQWRHLRTLLNTLADSGFNHPRVSLHPTPHYWQCGSGINAAIVLNALYPQEKAGGHSARVATDRSLHRLCERGLLFRDNTSCVYYLTGEGHAIACGDADATAGCISEAVSRMQPQRQSGRPRDNRGGLRDPNCTARTNNNKEWACRAALAFKKAVGDTRPFVYILGGYTHDDQGNLVADAPRTKLTLAAELGRLINRYSNGLELALELASDICKRPHVLSVKQAVRMVREYRGVTKPETSAPGTSGDLEDHLFKALAEYMDRRPDTSPDTIRQAVEGLADHCDDWTD